MTQEELSFQQRSLVQQGYKDYSAEQLAQWNWGLRFTPIVCSAITLVGLLTENPYLLLAISALGIWAYLAPASHPMDLLYNHVVQHLFKALALPPNPFQRRLACFAAGVMNAAAASLFLAGQPAFAKVLGGVLIALQMIVISTHFCALSWIYDIIVKLMGQWERPLELQRAQELLNKGAQLIDVREANEFARGHLEGAENYPLSALQREKSRLEGQVCLVYCASGMRSRMATNQLREYGEIEVYNLGGMSRGRHLKRRA